MSSELYKQLLANKTVSPSTVSGWKKEGKHPKWVDELAVALALSEVRLARINSLERDIALLQARYKRACFFGEAAAYAASNHLIPWNLMETIEEAREHYPDPDPEKHSGELYVK